MKIKKSKIFIILFAVVSVLLSGIIVLTYLSGIFKRTEDFATDDFVSETSYFYNRADYDNYCAVNGLIKSEKESNKKFTVAAVKKVAFNGGEGAYSESTEFRFLHIGLIVEIDENTSEYNIEGIAKWDNEKSFYGRYTAENKGWDFIGITWGGDGALVSTDQIMTGKYYKSDEVQEFSRRISDSYCGYVWQFKEKTGLYGKVLEYGKTNVVLTQDTLNRPENTSSPIEIKMTYLHTTNALYGNMALDGHNTYLSAPSVKFEAAGWFLRLEVSVMVDYIY